MLNALTILFVLVLFVLVFCTLLVIMLTKFSFILHTTTRRRFFKKCHAGLVNNEYQPLLNKIGRVLNYFQFTLS